MVTISSRDLPPALHDPRATVRLAGSAAPLRQRQGHRDPGTAPPDRGPATPGQITPADLGRPGRPGLPHRAAFHHPPTTAVADCHASHAPALARRAGQAPLDLSAPDTRTAGYQPHHPSARTANGPRQPDLGLPTGLRRADRPRAQDRALDHLGDSQGRRHRPRTATRSCQLETVPVRPGQDNRSGRLPPRRHRLPPPALRISSSSSTTIAAST